MSLVHGKSAPVRVTAFGKPDHFKEAGGRTCVYCGHVLLDPPTYRSEMHVVTGCAYRYCDDRENAVADKGVIVHGSGRMAEAEFPQMRLI